MLKNRRFCLKSVFDAGELDALLITDMKNIRYLCGFSGSEGALLLAPDQGWFLCDFRYLSQAADEVGEAEIVQFSVKHEAVAALVQKHGFRRLGFDAAHMTVAVRDRFVSVLGECELVPVGSRLDEIRAIKDSTERAVMHEVAEIASESLYSVLPFLKPGVRESHIALELEIAMRRRGADAVAFDFIVASGVRGALPHGRASHKCIEAGELVTIDFGAVKSGYHSDETVTIAVGEPGPKAREIYEIVKQAHDLALNAVKPGVRCCDVDLVARNYIKECGYGDFFGHGLGHGVGLDVHEQPVLSFRSEQILAEGMVVTIEPGIYLPGYGGVRIEDTVAVTESGVVLLTQVDKTLMVV